MADSTKIAFAIQKGGTAKTTSTLCLAGALVRQGVKVLILDLDPQANATGSLIDLNYLIENEIPTIHDVLTQKETNLSSCILPTASGIYIVPSTIKLSLVERHLTIISNGEKVLKKKLDELTRQAQTNPDLAFDFILMDCPPSLGMITINALAAANRIIIPLQTSIYAESGLSDFVNTFMETKEELNPDLELMGVVLTMVDNTRTSRDVADKIWDLLPGKVFKTRISRRTILSEVGAKGPIQDYAPNSESAQEYNALAEEVLNASR